MKIKQLLKCNIYDENDVAIGKACDIVYNAETGKCLPMLDDAVYDVDQITASKTCVVANNLQTVTGNYVSLVGKEVYDALGKRLGTVADATFYKTTMKLRRLVCDNGEQYGKSRILAINDIVLIKVAKPKQVKTTAKNEQIDISTSDDIKQTPVNTRPVNVSELAATRHIRRRYGDFSFLLGKKADKTITNFFNEVMIRSGETVTPETLRQAKISGKLIELCLHAK